MKTKLSDFGKVYGLKRLFETLGREYTKFDDGSSTPTSENEYSQEQVEETLLDDDEDGELEQSSQAGSDEASSDS